MRVKEINNVLENKDLLPMNLQLFAEAFEGSQNDFNNDDDNSNGNDDEGQESHSGDSDDNHEDDKKFTQADMTATATKEKKQGRRSAFKDLGFKSEEEAHKAVNEYREWKRSQLSDEELKNQKAKEDEIALSNAEARAQAAEDKLAVVMSGVRNDSVDDVLAIAKFKVTEDKSLTDVLSDMKKEDKYSSFFVNDPASSKGTGSGLDHSKGGNKKENIGERLAKQNNKSNDEKKSNYFN